MKVWVVEEEFPFYDGGDVTVSVHATEEGALDWINQQKHPNNYVLSDWEVGR